MVLRRIAGDVHALLIRDPFDKWGLPKGHLEEGEGSLEAAVREVREETGLEELVVGPELGTIDWYFRRDGALIHKYCAFFVMLSPSGAARPEVDEGITECMWLTLSDAALRVTYDNAREMVREALRLMDRGELPFDL